jgi:hypothetical protein
MRPLASLLVLASLLATGILAPAASAQPPEPPAFRCVPEFWFVCAAFYKAQQTLSDARWTAYVLCITFLGTAACERLP